MDRTKEKHPMQDTSNGVNNTLSLHATNIMQRDKEQSHRLHEPTSITNHTDPITGNDVMSEKNHPFVIDGTLKVYFDSDATRRTYLDMPFNHPLRKLNNKVSTEDDRGG